MTKEEIKNYESDHNVYITFDEIPGEDRKCIMVRGNIYNVKKCPVGSESEEFFDEMFQNIT